MNSDNSAIGGVTLDFGPFAFMEKFALYYNPWVGGGKPYSYGMQPNAASTNLVGLANAFAALALSETTKEERKADKASVVEALQTSISSGFGDTFRAKHSENCRAKLGLAAWDADAARLWDDLLQLMTSRSGQGTKRQVASTPIDRRPPGLLGLLGRAAGGAAGGAAAGAGSGADDDSSSAAEEQGGIDFTLLFQALSGAPHGDGSWSDGGWSAGEVRTATLDLLRPAALLGVEEWPADHVSDWAAWLERYARRVAVEARPDGERLAEMATANPRYIMRPWMAKEAYEAAERGDYSVVRELHQVLSSPYDRQGAEVEARWGQRTPLWARQKMGLAFMT